MCIKNFTDFPVGHQSLDFQGLFDRLVASLRVVCPMISYLEVPVSVPASADSRRSNHVRVSNSTHDSFQPPLSNTFIEMLLREFSQEPNHNGYCRDRGGGITRHWTMETAAHELSRLAAHDSLAVVWEPEDVSVPVGFASCEACHGDSILSVIDFPAGVKSAIYGQLGRKEPYLVITHLWLENQALIPHTQLMQQLIEEAVAQTMQPLHLTSATVLVMMSSRESDLRRRVLLELLQGRHHMLARDSRSGRYRELWGFKLCAH